MTHGFLTKIAAWAFVSQLMVVWLLVPLTTWSDQVPLGFQTQFRYDPLNRVDTIADARHGLTGFTYDPNGNLLTVTDANTHGTAYTYDTMDRLAARMDALNRQEAYQYDPDGNLIQFLDRKGQASVFTYDALNRRTGATYADGSSTTFTYDAVGRLTRVTDAVSGAIDYYYDTLDRLILEVTPQGAVAYEYDAIGRRTKMTVAGQAPVTYQYDADSRLTQVAQGSLTVSLGYDAAGRRTSLTYPNGVTTTYTYDNANRITTILHSGPGSTTIESLTYTYDAAGNRTSLSRANETASLLPAAVASATYDAANEQTQFGTATLTYDANGNLTNDGTNTYTWDARNRLVEISGGVSASFAYDPLGRRISKTINGVTTSFVYDGNDIVGEVQSGAMIAMYLRSLNIDELFGILRQDGAYFSIYDGLGSTLALTNQTASSVVQYSYEPFGKTQSSNPTFTNPFQFTGRENDQTGLYYYRARYYGPTLQRFLGEDPVLAPFTPLSVGLCQRINETIWILLARVNLNASDTSQYLHAYTYVQNNPVVLVDPLGLVASPCNYLDQVKKCSSQARGDNRPGPSGTTIGSCIGTEMEALGSKFVGGKEGACVGRNRSNKKCLIEDAVAVGNYCASNRRYLLPRECVEDLIDCIEKILVCPNE